MEKASWWRCDACETKYIGYKDEEGDVVCGEIWSKWAGRYGCPWCGCITATDCSEDVAGDIATEVAERVLAEDGQED